MQRFISLDVYDYAGHSLCNLYDSSIDIVGQATDVFVHTERNGFKEIRFIIPSTCDGERNYRLDYLVSDYRLRLREEKKEIYNGTVIRDNVEIDWFLLSETKVTHNAFSSNYDVSANHISQLLNTKNLNLEFSDDEGNNTGTISQIAETILEGTGWHLGNVATFYEEDKFSRGVQQEKVRSFTASAKTGAFKMMSDLCEMFDAKPIYHGEGTYIENGVTKTGRTVDIVPMNPFSEKLDEGVIPPDLNEEKVIELHYDKNVGNITRTLDTSSLVTVFSAYGSYGDRNGACTLQNAEHAVIFFSSLNQGNYWFEYNQARYYFEVPSTTASLEWSSLDYVSRSYVYNGTNLYKVYKEPKDDLTYTQIAVSASNTRYEKNYVTNIMDFSYYQKIGLLTDSMLLKLAQTQKALPAKHLVAQEASLALSDIKDQLSQTASDGNGFLMLDVQSSTVTGGYARLTLKKTTYPDGVIYRSDYDEAKRNRFSWNTAKGIKENGEAISGIGSVIYVVHQGDPTTWEKSYIKALGNDTDNYYRDSLGNIYELHTEAHYDHKEQVVGDSGTYFPNTGQANIIYVADDTRKLYVWTGSYTEIQASGYFYGLNEFPEPTTITLWTTTSTWHSGDKVYLFSADSIAGVFGPREDAVLSNRKSVEETVKVSTETHPLYFVSNSEAAPDVAACLSGYGWYYRSVTGTFSFGTLYFCWGKNGDVGWSQVTVSNDNVNPETLTVSTNYYYSLKRMMFYVAENGAYRAMDDSVDEEEITKAFAVVIDGCINQDVLTKGMKETYNFSGSQTTLAAGNYAFKNEFNNYWLFTTVTNIADTSLMHYDTSSKMLWPDNDEDHIVKAVEHSFRYLDFPRPNELYEVTFTKGAYTNGVFKPEGTQYISNNIYVHDNTSYQFSLPTGKTIVCLDSNQRVLGTYTTSPFTTPNQTSHVRVIVNQNSSGNNPITNSHYLRVTNYNNVFFCKNKQYTILSCTGAGERLGLNYLMDKFIRLAHEAYEVKLPALTQAQQDITDMNIDLANTLGDMYREGFWQENSYVEGDEDKLYTDSLDNLKEISHPQATYEVKFLDLYGSDDNLGDNVKTDWPDIDINYAAHLIDMDIDTNRWAYIDSIDKCYDQPWKTEIEINTRLSMIGQQSFTDVLAKIAEVANETKAKQTVYSRAGVIGSAGQLAADRLEGMIQANRVYLLGGTSNWYTDSKGNIIFEAADGNSAMMLTGRGLMISNEKDAYGDWTWRTAISGLGINADNIATGEFSAKHIIAGTITTDKLSSSVGQELEIGSNKALELYATVDGERPIEGLETKHPNEGDSWIKIAAKNGNNPAYIDIQSGGKVNVYGTSSVNIGSQGTLNLQGGTIDVTSNGKMTINSGTLDIKSTGVLLIDSENFKIVKNTTTNKYDVTIKGNITTTGGKIAGFTIGSANNIDYMYSGSTTSISSNANGVYIGTNGINIGGKFVYAYDGSTAKLSINASNITLGDITGFTTLSGKLGDMDTKTSSAQTAANNAQSTADSKSKTYRATKSTMLNKTDFVVGDIWQDSDSNGYGYEYVCKKNYDSSYSSSTFDNYWSLVGTSVTAGAKLAIDAAAGTINMVAANTITIAAGATISIAASKKLSLTTNGTIEIGKGVKPFTIGGTDGTGGHAYIYNGVTSIDDEAHDGIYLGTDGVVLGKGKFKVTTAGALTSTSADIKGAIKATSLYIGATSSANGTQLKLDTNGLVMSNSATASDAVKTTAGIKVDSSGVVLSSSTSNAATAVQSAAGITIDNSGVVISSSTSDIATAVKSAAGITVNATTGIVMSSSSGDSTAVTTTLNKIAAVILSGSKIDPTSLTTAAQNAITKAANISVTDGRINLSSLSTSVVNTTSLSTTLANYATIDIVPDKISALTFDTFGNSSQIQISPTKITAGSSGDVDFSAAKSFSIKAGAITVAAISDIDSSYYGVKTGVTIANGEVKAQSGNNYAKISTAGVDVVGGYINLTTTSSNKIAMNSSGIALTGNNLSVSGGSISLTTSGASIVMNSSGLKINNRLFTDANIFARDDIRIVAKTSDIGTVEQEMTGKGDWVMIRPYYNALVKAGSDSDVVYSGICGSSNSFGKWLDLRYKTGETVLGNGASWYKYEVSVLLKPDSTGSQITSGTARIKNSSGDTVDVTISGEALLYDRTWTGTLAQSSTNLCKDGEILSITFKTSTAISVDVKNIVVQVTSDTTKSRVPCTVYYYPPS